ncbi:MULTISPECIES: histidinol-phosphate transaminase [Saccharothrix]|uniref:histidinol-phosphate transaminase n=1 Tax=Saccharothrix TaxID=2071 RepID=UPI0009391E8F|nr:histidinol-phosphate transaminase [Saccharothrix sp. CB00851]OKI25188.1 aminotransferase [Saccharothrix sp. CB00851]
MHTRTDLASDAPATTARLAGNEMPFGPLPGVVEAIAGAAAEAHRYPDLASVELREALARRCGVTADRVVTGCGSAALFAHLVASVGGEVVHSWRSFEAYPMLVAASGGTSVPVPVTPEHRHDLPAMAAAVGPRTRLVVVCNPDNPTGTTCGRAELDRFVAGVPSDVLVVIDEAYREFVTDLDVPDALAAYGDRPNVVVLRTLSKAWGLAGLRLGYLIAHPEVAAAVGEVVIPFSTNAVAQAAGLAALDAEVEMARRVAVVVAERERVADELADLVPDVPPSQGNFLWLPLGEAAEHVGRACAREGVLVRAYAGEGVRMTIGTPAQNNRFLVVLRHALRTGRRPLPA